MFTNHGRRYVSWGVILLGAAAAVSLTGCTAASNGGPQTPATIARTASSAANVQDQAHAADPSAPEAIPLAPAPSRVVRVAILEDQTGSRRSTRTERVTANALDRLIDFVMRTGGTLVLGAIRDTSNRPLVRLSVRPGPVPPAPPSTPDNPFQAAEARAQFQASEKQYREKYVAWEYEVQPSVAEFRKAALTLLAREDEAGRTDVWGGLQRVDLALSEPVPPGHHVAAFIFLVSDAEDNRRLRHEPLRSGATLLLVNGAGRLGVLAPLNPLRFEALDAAVDYVVSEPPR
jgi:hypothetical protein